MKKTILKLGLLSTLTIPLTAVISCSGQDNSNKLVPDVTPAITNPLAINGKIVEVADDGLYFTQESYKDGYFWDSKVIGKNEGRVVEKDVIEAPRYLYTNQHRLNENIIEFGKGDSFYFLFDEDKNDGYTIEEFTKELFFVDTSTMGGGTREIAFEGNEISGHIQSWDGSQSNHIVEGTFNDSMTKLKSQVSEQTFINTANYYGVFSTPDENGIFQTNPAIPNHASRIFFPVTTGNYFSYEKVASNAIKITMDNPNNNPITAAYFMTHSSKPIDGQIKTYGYETFSLGTQSEWDRYEHSTSNMKYHFFARKEPFVRHIRNSYYATPNVLSTMTLFSKDEIAENILIDDIKFSSSQVFLKEDLHKSLDGSNVLDFPLVWENNDVQYALTNDKSSVVKLSPNGVALIDLVSLLWDVEASLAPQENQQNQPWFEETGFAHDIVNYPNKFIGKTIFGEDISEVVEQEYFDENVFLNAKNNDLELEECKAQAIAKTKILAADIARLNLPERWDHIAFNFLVIVKTKQGNSFWFPMWYSNDFWTIYDGAFQENADGTFNRVIEQPSDRKHIGTYKGKTYNQDEIFGWTPPRKGIF